MEVKERLIIALDVDTLPEALSLVDLLGNRVGLFKVGLQLLHNEGPRAIQAITQRGGRVFADFKFHDIPNTVTQATRAVVRQGVHMLNLHAAGGKEMMTAVAQAAREEAERLDIPRPIILGVTVLTSLDKKVLAEEVGLQGTLPQVVARWAALAQAAGLDGVVASAQEIGVVRTVCGKDFVVVTPGVRPAGGILHDQKRVMTPGGAIAAGADYVVIGRPVTATPNPLAAVEAILAEMEESYIA